MALGNSAAGVAYYVMDIFPAALPFPFTLVFHECFSCFCFLRPSLTQRRKPFFPESFLPARRGSKPCFSNYGSNRTKLRRRPASRTARGMSIVPSLVTKARLADLLASCTAGHFCNWSLCLQSVLPSPAPIPWPSAPSRQSTALHPRKRSWDSGQKCPPLP